MGQPSTKRASRKRFTINHFTNKGSNHEELFEMSALEYAQAFHDHLISSSATHATHLLLQRVPSIAKNVLRCNASDDWRCETRFCPRCHTRRNRKKIEIAQRRLPDMRKISERFYVIGYGVELLDIDSLNADSFAEAVSRITALNREIWAFLRGTSVHGVYFAIAVSPSGWLHVHALVHGKPGDLSDFFGGRGLDLYSAQALDAEKLASYGLRAVLEWGRKEPGPEHQHTRHPNPELAARLCLAMSHHPDLHFSRPFGTFRGDLTKRLYSQSVTKSSRFADAKDIEKVCQTVRLRQSA